MLIRNTLQTHRTPLDARDSVALGADAAQQAARFFAAREGYAQTPLASLPALAGELGIASVHIKDEGQRLGLGSFKALGGAYAVVRLAVEAASRQAGRPIDIADWRNDVVTEAASRMTFACATDGNHGRSVAQGASLLGAQCVIFIHPGVSEERASAIARFGAQVVRAEGAYDDTVVAAADQARANGWIDVSDASGNERVVHLVMGGYTVMLGEVFTQMAAPPTHVFAQAGGGGLAAAIAGHFVQIYGAERPFVTVVEPSAAACVFESARAGLLVNVAPTRPTVMAMLECYAASSVAWRILSSAADAFMTIEDDEAVAVMKRLAYPADGDPAIVAGESGGAGLAALMRVAGDAEARQTIGLGRGANVLLINSEGATDPALYERLVGATPDTIAASSPREAPARA